MEVVFLVIMNHSDFLTLATDAVRSAVQLRLAANTDVVCFGSCRESASSCPEAQLPWFPDTAAIRLLEERRGKPAPWKENGWRHPPTALCAQCCKRWGFRALPRHFPGPAPVARSDS